jgi:large subunit ribosomal protein L18
MSATRSEARSKRHARVRKSLRGTAQRPRLAVFRSNRHIYAQVIDDDLGTTLAQASSRELSGGPLSVAAAAEVGKLIGARASDAEVGEVVFDRGGFPFHGRVKALAEAAREAGLRF